MRYYSATGILKVILIPAAFYEMELLKVVLNICILKVCKFMNPPITVIWFNYCVYISILLLVNKQFYIKILSKFKYNGLRANLLYMRLIFKLSIINSDPGASI